MVSMSKYEIATYLQDYCDFIYTMNLYPTTPIKDVWFSVLQDKHQFEKHTYDYYCKMRLVYNWLITMKGFSLAEDVLLNRDNYINNTHLEYDLENVSLDITKKELIKLIRNAFNHNNSEKVERFKISKNARYIMIEFLNIKKTDGSIGPLAIRFDNQQIQSIYDDMTEKRQTGLFIEIDTPKDIDIDSDHLYQDLDQIRIKYYYINGKLHSDIIEKANQINDESKTESYRNNLFFDLAQEYGELLEYKLSKIQKDRLFELILKFKSTYKNIIKKLDDEFIIKYLINNYVSVVPARKIRQCTSHSIFCLGLLLYNQSFFDLQSIIVAALDGVNPFKENDELGQLIYEKINNKTKEEIFEFYMDFDENFVNFSILIYVEFVIAHCCNEEYIIIDNQQFNVEKIRNSLVHSRWHSNGQEIVFYDADPRNVNLLNTELVGSINIDSLKGWADNYLEENKYRLEIQKSKKVP